MTAFTEINQLGKGDLYKISDGKATYYIGRCFDGKTWLLGGFLEAENLLYKNVSEDRKYKKADAIAKLKSWLGKEDDK